MSSRTQLEKHIYGYMEEVENLRQRIIQGMVVTPPPKELVETVRAFVRDSVNMTNELGVITPNPSRIPYTYELAYDWSLPFTLVASFFDDIAFLRKQIEVLNEKLLIPSQIDVSQFAANILMSWENRKKIETLSCPIRLTENENRIDLNCIRRFLARRDLHEDRGTLESDDQERGLAYTTEATALRMFRWMPVHSDPHGPIFSPHVKNLKEAREKYTGSTHRRWIEVDVTTLQARIDLVTALDRKLHPDKDRMEYLKEVSDRYVWKPGPTPP